MFLDFGERQLGVGGNFSAASINLAVYAPDEAYAFVEDPLGSTTDGPVFFRDHFDSALTAYPQFAPAFGGQIPSLWGPTSYNASELGLSARYVASVGIPYDPCDEDGDPKLQGLRLKSKLKRCLTYPAGGICYSSPA